MQDLRFFYFVDLLAVDRATDLGGTPRGVRLDGHRGLDQVAEVRVQGQAAPQVAVLSPTSLQVQLPAALQAADLASLSFEVLSTRCTGRYPNKVVLDLGAQPERVEGLELLVQLVLRKLLLTPGTNRDSPGEGVGLGASRGVLLAQRDAGRLQALLYDGVQRVAEEVRLLQSGDSRYSAEERLRSLTVGAVSVDAAAGRMQATLYLASEAGATRAVPLVL